MRCKPICTTSAPEEVVLGSRARKAFILESQRNRVAHRAVVIDGKNLDRHAAPPTVRSSGVRPNLARLSEKARDGASMLISKPAVDQS